MKRFLPLVLFILLVLVFFYPFFFKQLFPIPADITIGAYFPWLDYKWGTITGVAIKNSLPSDIPSLMFPNKLFAIKILLSGHLPDWNKYTFSGTELFQGGQTGAFYPLNLIYLLTDFLKGWSLQVVLQPFVALTTTYLLARYLKISRVGSIFAAITFSFSGFMIAWLEYNVQGHVLSLLPLVLLTALRVFDHPRPRNYALYSISLALQVLAGYPQFTLYTLIFVAISRFVYKVPRLSSLINLFLFTAIGLSLASVQLFPLLDFFHTSTRFDDTGSLVATNMGYFPFRHLVTLISPNFFGNPSTGNYTGTNYFDNFSTYPGVAALVLAFYSLRNKNKSKKLFWLGLCLSLLLSLKTTLSKFLLESNLPGFGSGVAARAMSLFTFCIAILAGLGLDHFIDQVKKNKIPLFYFVSFSFLLLLYWIVPASVYWYQRQLLGTQVLQSIQQVTLRNLVIPTLIVYSITITLLVKKLFGNKLTNIFAIFFCVLFISLQFGDMFMFGQKYLSFVPASFVFPSTPVIDFLKQNAKEERILGGDVIPMNMWMPYELKSAAGYDALYSSRYADFLGKLRGLPGPAGRFGNLINYPDTFDFNSTSTRYILAKKYLRDVPDSTGAIHTEFQLPHLKPVFEDGTVVVLENIKYHPLAYQLSDSQIISVDYKQLLNGDFEISFANEKPVDLIISSTYTPSWRAVLDSRPFALESFNEVYLKLSQVPPGSHQLRLIHHPRTMNLAVATTLVSCIGLLLCLKKYP